MQQENKKTKEEKPEQDPHDGEYIGNIWGWKNSYIGLVIILVMIGLAFFRAWQLDMSIIEVLQQAKGEEG